MGQFIITRTAKGDCFCLRSDSGRTLAVSRHYATLDACKKGIASLIINAPFMPVLDATAGEYGKNPKFEIVSAEGGVAYLVKSPNGKTVITSPVYATKKACLRAISMLRRGVLDVEILFYNKEGYTPIVMKALDGITLQPNAKKQAIPQAPVLSVSEGPLNIPATEDLAKEPEEVWDISVPDASVPPSPTAPLKRAPTAPRLIRLQPTARKGPQKSPQKSDPGRTLGGIFDRIFKK